MSRRGLAYMLFSGLNFALMSLMVGIAHQLQPSLSAAMTSLMRAAVNLVLLLMLTWKNPRQLLGDGRAALWVRGLMGAFALLAYVSALARVGIGEASFLNQTSAFWVALLAPILLKEASSRWNWLAIVGAMGGMLLLSYPRVGLMDDTLGRVLGALSGFLAALAYVSVRKAGQSNPPTTIVFYFTVISVVISAVILQFEPIVWPEGWQVWGALVLVGVFATLGQLFMTMAYKIGPAVSVAVTAYACPLLTSLLGVVLMDQRPDLAGWLGMGLILLSGVALPALKTLGNPLPSTDPPLKKGVEGAESL